MRITIRSFDAKGYHKDIFLASEKQVHMTDHRITEPISSIHTGLIGYGGSIDPALFSEMVKFEIVIEKE